MPPPDAAVDRRRALTLGALATLVYLVTAPAAPNGDGLGYLKLLPHNFAAGHLLYMPLLRAATALVGDGLRAGRLVNALLGGSGVVLTYGLVRRALSSLPLGRPFAADDVRFAATFAAAGLALSYGYWVQASDVEAYAAATVALLATVRLAVAYALTPTWGRALGTGALLGLAALCHVTHVVLAPFVAGVIVLYAPSRRRGLVAAAASLALGGALVVGAYAWAALVVRGHDLAGAVRWIATAGHGFRESGGLYRIGDAMYGLAKSLIYAPYAFEGDGPRLLTLFVAGLLPLGALALLVGEHHALLPPRLWRVGLLWVGPYALLGLAFFGSDSERWIFVLPALWLVAGAMTTRLPRRGRAAGLVLAYFALVNWSAAIGPARHDRTIEKRVAEIAPALRDGDLVVFPGHGWDEYVWLYGRARVEPFPLSYYAARDGVDAALARLARDLARVEAAGGRAVTARLFVPWDGDGRGFDELRLLGVDRDALERRLREAFTVERLDDRVWRLRPLDSAAR
jgi:hypothetical protein